MKFPTARNIRGDGPLRPPRREFPDIVDRDFIEDLLLDRGICCETERMDWNDVRHALSWCPDDTKFKLVQIDPLSITQCVLPAKRFKRWPIVVGFPEDGDYSNGTAVVDGLHRSAVANHRRWKWIWAYAPIQPNGERHTADTIEEAIRKRYAPTESPSQAQLEALAAVVFENEEHTAAKVEKRA